LGLYGVAAAIIGGASVWGDRGGAHTALLGSVVVVLIMDFNLQHGANPNIAYWLIFGLAAITLALDGIGGSKDGLTLRQVASSAGTPRGMDAREI
jgi:ribose/xylose/arabinose/galactoside ABC-type transport system permease subunit